MDRRLEELEKKRRSIADAWKAALSPLLELRKEEEERARRDFLRHYTDAIRTRGERR